MNTINFPAIAPSAAHNFSVKTIEFKMAAVSVKRSINWFVILIGFEIVWLNVNSCTWFLKLWLIICHREQTCSSRTNEFISEFTVVEPTGSLYLIEPTSLLTIKALSSHCRLKLNEYTCCEKLFNTK